MKRRARRAVGACRGVAAAFLLALCARAQGPATAAADIHVTVDCPALDAEHRAALEARAKSDLIVRHETGSLVFQCIGPAGAVAWTPASGQTLRAEITLPSNADAAIDALLESAERLLVTSHDAPPAAAPSPPLVVSTPAAETPPPPQPVVAPPPEAPAVRPEPSQKASRGVPLGVAAGAALEIWDWVPALGPGVLLGWYVAPQLRLEAGGTLLFTTEDNLGIGGRLVRLHAGGELALGDERRFRLGAGVLVETLKATDSDGGESAQDTAYGGRLHGHFAAPLSSAWNAAFGPFLSGRAAPVKVELGSTEAFRIPVVTGGLEIQLEWDAR